MHGFLIALVLATTLPPPSPSPPQAPIGPYPSSHRHDSGLLLRVDLGVGYLGSSIDSQPSMSVKGAGPEVSLVVGGLVSENLSLGGHLWIMGAISPTLEQGSVSVSTGTDTSNTLVGLGPNITYFIMPANVYLSASAGLTRLSITTSAGTGTSDAGFGMQLAVGKEWWVSERWGIGAAAQLLFSTNSDRNSGPNIGTLGGGLAMSMTYN